jgi:hypothetical protein
MGKYTRKMVLMGLCTVGVAAFVIDRVQSEPPVTGPPQAAAAAGAQPATTDSDLDNAPQPAAVDPDALCRKRLATRLQTLTGGNFPPLTDIREAFQPSGDLQVKADAPAAAPAEPVGRPHGEVFAANHKLRAVMVSPQGRVALIDNTCLKVGQKVEDYQVVSIGERSAVLVSPSGDRVTFELPIKPDAP